GAPLLPLVGWDVYCLVFFFSSRRRHTRFSRDWSSDVCSSDLVRAPGLGPGAHRGRGQALGQPLKLVADTAGGALHGAVAGLLHRSEERRVGKECRVGWEVEDW